MRPDRGGSATTISGSSLPDPSSFPEEGLAVERAGGARSTGKPDRCDKIETMAAFMTFSRILAGEAGERQLSAVIAHRADAPPEPVELSPTGQKRKIRRLRVATPARARLAILQSSRWPPIATVAPRSCRLAPSRRSGGRSWRRYENRCFRGGSACCYASPVPMG